MECTLKEGTLEHCSRYTCYHFGEHDCQFDAAGLMEATLGDPLNLLPTQLPVMPLQRIIGAWPVLTADPSPVFIAPG